MASTKNPEWQLEVLDYSQLLGCLSIFDTTLTQPYCQTTISQKETTLFSKGTNGRSDLFTTSLRLAPGQENLPESTTLFVPDLKKFIQVLKNVGKYYDTKDRTTFLEQKVRISMAQNSSYVRISSKKYSVKFQLSTNAILESQRANMEQTLTPSRYGETMHQATDRAKLLRDFLLIASVDPQKFDEVKELMSSLAETAESSIKIQTTDQARLEDDVNSDLREHSLYATISDNQKLVRSSIGNKVSVEFGSVSSASEELPRVCPAVNLVSNFVFLCSKSILDQLADTCKTFAARSRAKTIELAISKPNLMHLNLETLSETAKSEIYVSTIGMKATSIL